MADTTSGALQMVMWPFGRGGVLFAQIKVSSCSKVNILNLLLICFTEIATLEGLELLPNLMPIACRSCDI